MEFNKKPRGVWSLTGSFVLFYKKTSVDSGVVVSHNPNSSLVKIKSKSTGSTESVDISDIFKIYPPRSK